MSEPQEDQQAIAAALAQDMRTLIKTLRRKMRAQADAGDLPPSQVAVLQRLEAEGAMTVSALARVEGMRPQSMAPVVAALEAAGLVAGYPDPKDGRQTLFDMTEHCRHWRAQGRAARQDWLTRAFLRRYTPQELAMIAQATTLLGRLIEE